MSDVVTPPPPPPPIETSVDLWDPFGQPGELRVTADAWDAMANRLDAIAARMGGLVTATAPDWSGEAYQAFSGHWGDEHRELGEGAEGMREVARQLRAIADELEAKNDLVQAIYVTIGAAIGVSILVGMVSFGAGAAAGAAAVAAKVAEAERLRRVAQAFLVAQRTVMATTSASRVATFATRFAGFTARGAVVTAAVKQVAIDESAFDRTSWTVADVAGVALGGLTGAGLTYRGAALAGTRVRSGVSAFVADASTSAAVDIIGGTATPGQIISTSAMSGVVGGALSGSSGSTAGQRLGARAAAAAPIPPMGMTRQQFAELGDRLREGLRARLGEDFDDVRVQGSRAGYTAGPTSDVDIMVRVPPDRFEALLANSKVGNPRPGSAAERTRDAALQRGRIHSGEVRLSSLRNELANWLGLDVDLSIVRADGLFDAPPQKSFPR